MLIYILVFIIPSTGDHYNPWSCRHGAPEDSERVCWFSKIFFTRVDDKHTCCNPFPHGTCTCLGSAQIETLAMFTSISNILKGGAIIIFNAYSLIDVNIQFIRLFGIW